MKKLFILSLLLLITACNQNRHLSEKNVVYPARLSPNNSIVVNYDSDGCFQHYSNVLLFKKDSVTVYDKIDQWNQKYAKKKKVVDASCGTISPKSLGSFLEFIERARK